MPIFSPGGAAGGGVTPAVWVDPTATKFEANIIEALVDAELAEAGAQHDVITFGTPSSSALSFTCSITNFDANYDYSATATNGSVSINGSGLITVTGLTAEQSSTVTVTVQGAGKPLRTGTVTGTAAAATITDNFNRADETTSTTTSSGATWTNTNGRIGVTSNQGVFSGGNIDGSLVAVGMDTGAINHFNKFTYKSNSNAPAVRCTDGQVVTNSYFLSTSTTTVGLFRGTGSTAASYVNIANDIFGAGVGITINDVIRMEAEGTTLRVYKNGTLMYTNTGITNNSATGIGFYTSSGHIEDFECGAL